MANNKYGERLKMYRKHAKLTQKELANIIGVDHSVISNWERGINKFDVDMLIPLSQALKISLNDLIGFYTDYSLNPDEEKLIKTYRKLGKPGNELLLKAAETLLIYKEGCNDTHKKMGSRIISHPVFTMPASAGTGSFLDSDDYELIDFPEDTVPRESNFGVRVSGDSMEPDYKNGSIVFVKQTKEISPGDIGIFVLNNEGFIKVLGDSNNLISLNPKYKDIIIKSYDDCRLVGKVVGDYNGL